MKKWFLIIAALVIAGYASYVFFYFIRSNVQPINSDEYRVLIAYSKANWSKSDYIMNAYQSVLTEEGVPCEAVEIVKLCATPAAQIAKNIPAIIFPDALLQSMPEEALAWIKDYLNLGGSLAVIYDAGIQEYGGRGAFLKRALLSDVVGVNYMTFNQYQEASYTTGQIQFMNRAAADYFQIPPGKLIDNFFLSGYFYGRLNYPVAHNQRLDATPPDTIFAQIVTARGEEFPAITLKKYGQGNVLYVNLPLGYLKANTDDLPLRTILRTFLFQIVRMPHLVNTNQGRGRLVLNWHVDSNGEWKNIATAIANQYLDPALRSSIHITAGDFRDKPGDGFGFDACGQGRTYAQQYLPYGIIGSHGGWAHNWFAKKQEKTIRWPYYNTKRYIKKNIKCLESITHYRLLEYSAPIAAHPQPATTKILENMGLNSYYYTGDSGSAPNRTFVDGKMVSEIVIAFPMLSNGKWASLYEMKKANLAEKDVQKWLTDLIDYVVEKRTTRLFHSHINDIFNYPQAMHHFLQYAKQKQSRGELQVEPMSEIASFLQKFIKTRYNFRHQGNDLSVLLQNEEGLRGITVAVPRRAYRVDTETNVGQSEDKDYYYLTVQEDVKEKTILVHGF